MNNSSGIDVPVIHSEVTYLEMVENPRLTSVDLGRFAMRRVENIGVADYLDVYREVGRDYLWNYRPGQSLDEISAILHSPHTWMYVLFEEDRAVGMAELDASNPEDVELVHFGLIPSLLNQGIGKLFLRNIVSLVWESGVSRMWLSTCGMDHPKAIRFYEAAGFAPFKVKMGEFKNPKFHTERRYLENTPDNWIVCHRHASLESALTKRPLSKLNVSSVLLSLMDMRLFVRLYRVRTE